VGFLNFLHKKKGETAKEPLTMPLPPPKLSGEDELLPAMPQASGEEEMGLPDFPEGKEGEELRLPDIDELEHPDVSEGPNIPELTEPEPQEFPVAKTATLEPMEIPELQLPPQEEPKPVEEEASEVYKHTPAKPTGGLFHREEPEHVPLTGDVFIRAEDYRELLEELNRVITEQKEKFAKEERNNFIVEEREYDKFIATVEDMQRELIVTENTLFE